MAKFATARHAPNSPVTTTGARTVTHEGGAALTRDAKSDPLQLCDVPSCRGVTVEFRHDNSTASGSRFYKEKTGAGCTSSMRELR